MNGKISKKLTENKMKSRLLEKSKKKWKNSGSSNKRNRSSKNVKKRVKRSSKTAQKSFSYVYQMKSCLTWEYADAFKDLNNWHESLKDDDTEKQPVEVELNHTSKATIARIPVIESSMENINTGYNQHNKNAVVAFPLGAIEEHACVESDVCSAKELEFYKQQSEHDKESESAHQIKALDMPSDVDSSEPPVQEFLQREADLPTEVGDKSCERPYESNYQTTLQPSTSAVEVEEGRICLGITDHIPVSGNATQNNNFSNGSGRHNSSGTGSTMSGHTRFNEYECLSEKSSNNSSAVKPHMESELSHKQTDGNELPCSTNPTLITQKCGMDQDNSIGTDGKTCSICRKSFRYRCLLKLHMRCHSVERPYTCRECGKSFQTNYALTTHLRTHTGDKPFSCDVCGKSFALKHTLQQHKFTHSGEKPYSCPQCTHSFSQRNVLDKHMKTHTGKRPYTCKECGKSFTENSNLTVHIRTHTGDKPFRCDVCAKSFASKQTMQIHKFTHNGEKPHSCSQCTYSCSDKKRLVEHMRTHSGEKPFTCEDCGKMFALKKQLKLHTRIHTGEKPFSCDACGKKFRSSSNLIQHVRTHRTKKKPVTESTHLKGQPNKEKDFLCSYCDTCFSSNGVLMKHLRTHR